MREGTVNRLVRVVMGWSSRLTVPGSSRLCLLVVSVGWWVSGGCCASAFSGHLSEHSLGGDCYGFGVGALFDDPRQFHDRFLAASGGA